MIDLAKPMSGLLAPAAGLEAGVRELLAQQLQRHAVLQRRCETAQAKLSIRPLTVEPSLAMVMKISPGHAVFVEADGE